MPGTMMSAAEVEAFLDRDFPQLRADGRRYDIVSVGHRSGVLRLRTGERHLRPGGTVSGPTLMELADLAMYVAILGTLGPVALAVTSSLSINFLRRPKPGTLLGDCRLLKVGRRLVVGEVAVRPEASDDAVAHVVATYALPAR